MDVRTAIYRYCNYQPRCHYEVRNKLYEIGCKADEVNELIAELIEKDLLNEERYARAIARGKFRIKHWGRQKIVQQLKLNKISDYCIRKALTEIDTEEYYQTLLKQTEKKWHEFRGDENVLLRKNKVYRYLMQKGFEPDMIWDAINQIVKSSEGG